MESAMKRRRGVNASLVLACTLLGGCDACCDIIGDCRVDPITYEPPVCVGPRGIPDTEESADCRDDFEPNGDLTVASTTGKLECGMTQKLGRIANVRDVDVYRTGSCALGLGTPVGSFAKTLEPSVYVDTDALVRTCMFPTCVNGDSNVYKCFEQSDGAAEREILVTRSNSAFHGCCRIGRGAIRAEMDCAMFSAAIDTHFWVDAGDESLSCAEYELSWTME